MPDTRKKDSNWLIDADATGTTVEQAQLAVLMDIRDELKKLNRIFACENFLDIPRKLDVIQKNTKKPARRRKEAA